MELATMSEPAPTVADMNCQIGVARVHYVEHGTGLPLIALHGAGVDHREIEAALEPIVPAGLRRVYPDLPGMGRSTADGLRSNDDVVALLGEFVEQLGDGPVLLLGHSYGGYLARGLAARRPELVRGLALCCPVGEGSGELPERAVVRSDADADAELEPAQREGFADYFVVRTRATARRYRDSVVPGNLLVDEQALERVFGGWRIDIGSADFSAPTLIVVGRHDTTAGWRAAFDLLEHYPHASYAVVDGAGHALMHERPELLAPLLADWLERAARSG